jgi:predicted RNase H-like HicB family nuclease
MSSYIALIHKDEGSDYGVSFPDLPGCATAGFTLDEARVMAEEALALHLEGLTVDREAIPQPSSLEAVMSNPENRDGVAVLVRAPVRSRKVVRVDVTFPEDVLREIDHHTALHGYTRSGFLAVAAMREIEREGEKRDRKAA